MASVTFFNPTPTLPAIITEPPISQFTPGPDCVDPNDHWVVITSCFAIASEALPSPDWLTCAVTQFGPPQNGDISCYLPTKTTVDDIATYYSGCPSGYSTAAEDGYSYNGGARSIKIVHCCPTQYHFKPYTGNGVDTTTVRDGVEWSVAYPLPRCVASYVDELEGKEIAVRTQLNTGGWEKRQLETISWDWRYDTMFAEDQVFSYTVFHSTHTCYDFLECINWSSYYFSGGPLPSFTIPDSVPITTTPAVESTPTTTVGEIETPSPEETPIEEPSPYSTGSADSDSTPVISSVQSIPTPTLSPGGSSGNVTFSQSPSSTVSIVPEGAARVLSPTRFALLGLFMSLAAL
ncbi:hypothetical protein NUW58_g2213 [Xylaria curta]|uniref:Uncharacterized protein n=1 Tax=Xylaria curta TaxID=42375 RepID=A0ACC1PJD4_9PEZI|nr:hypothetical protein NUW58_g2213 [Xylaria curta]